MRGRGKGVGNGVQPKLYDIKPDVSELCKQGKHSRCFSVNCLDKCHNEKDQD